MDMLNTTKHFQSEQRIIYLIGLLEDKFASILTPETVLTAFKEYSELLEESNQL